MAIYIDANVLWNLRTFSEPQRLGLSIVADQIGQRILIPQVAAWEATAHYRRSLHEATERHEAAVSDLGRAFQVKYQVDIDPVPNVERAVANWERRLGQFADVLPLIETDAVAALRREIEGLPPASRRKNGAKGKGARDAAIWLAAVRHCREANEEAHFVTEDSDFGCDGQLHPDLQSEIGDLSHSFNLYTSVNSFVTRLGKAEQAEVDLEELTSIFEVAIADAIRESPEPPRAMWHRLNPAHRYRTALNRAEIKSIRDARRYTGGECDITVVDAELKLNIDAMWQSDATDRPELWSVIDNLPADGPAQIYLANGSAQLISEQFHYWAHIDLHDDGTLSIWDDREIARLSKIGDLSL